MEHDRGFFPSVAVVVTLILGLAVVWDSKFVFVIFVSYLGTGLVLMLFVGAAKFYHMYAEASTFKFLDLDAAGIRTEYRSNMNALLIVMQKTGWFPVDGFLFQTVAQYLTRLFNDANINFSTTGADPKEAIRKFCSKHGIKSDVDASAWEWSKRPEEYTCINEFFMRRYRTFTLASSCDLTSPATSVVKAYPCLDSMDCLVKGTRYTIDSCGVPDPEAYAGHPCFYFYLSPADYHCFHAPLAGTVERFVDLRHLPHCSSSVKLDLLSPKVFTHNRRCIVVIRGCGGDKMPVRIALVIIGGFLVDSIRLTPELREGAAVAQGQFLGAFALGGSAILMLADREDVALSGILGRAAARFNLPTKVNAGAELGQVGKLAPPRTSDIPARPAPAKVAHLEAAVETGAKRPLEVGWGSSGGALETDQQPVLESKRPAADVEAASLTSAADEGSLPSPRDFGERLPGDKLCYACGSFQPRTSFSGSMWKRAAKRRCTGCVDANRSIPGLNTDIAKAAGVVWTHDMPARMKDMQARHDAILALSESGGLTKEKLREYHDWLARLTQAVASEGEAMKRTHKLAMAKHNRTQDAKKAKAFAAQADAISTGSVRHNNEVAMVQLEVAWLLNSTAWKKMVAFLKEHWVSHWPTRTRGCLVACGCSVSMILVALTMSLPFKRGRFRRSRGTGCRRRT